MFSHLRIFLQLEDFCDNVHHDLYEILICPSFESICKIKLNLYHLYFQPKGQSSVLAIHNNFGVPIHAVSIFGKIFFIQFRKILHIPNKSNVVHIWRHTCVDIFTTPSISLIHYRHKIVVSPLFWCIVIYLRNNLNIYCFTISAFIKLN